MIYRFGVALRLRTSFAWYGFVLLCPCTVRMHALHHRNAQAFSRTVIASSGAWEGLEEKIMRFSGKVVVCTGACSMKSLLMHAAATLLFR
jgi:hypothetical protein